MNEVTSAGQRLRKRLAQGPLLLPGAFNALSARLAWRCGAEGVYLSGGAITNSLLGMPDEAVITLDEMVKVAGAAAQAAPVPMICDADTGFGEDRNVARTVRAYEAAGLAGLHLEDQESPKRCGHLEGKTLVAADHMAEKVAAAASARRDPDFMIIARTDARGVLGMEPAIERAQLYIQAGADAIFPEGLKSEEEFSEFRQAVSAPLLANMTEFGKTPLIRAPRFFEIGYEMVIFPVSAMRVAMGAVEGFYRDLLAHGTQADWLDRMMTRQELYDLLDYDGRV